MNQPRTRRRRKARGTQNLIKLIGILLVVLVVMICVALCAKPKSGGDTPDGSTGPVGNSQKLVITEPAQNSFITVADAVVFAGQSDPGASLQINGVDVQRAADGSFSRSVPLENGMNTIVLSHKGETLTYQVERRYAVETFAPAGDMTYNSGATMQIAVGARQGSTVEVTLGGKKIEMKKSTDQIGSGLSEGFVLYTGTYKMPTNNTADVELGKITYKVTCSGVTESYTSGNIVCLKPADLKDSDPSVTPNYGEYIDVGSGFIVEILASSAETFVGTNRYDYSDPRNNYLPAGTVDYASSKVVTNPSGSLSFRLMRCGYKVYVQKKNYPPAGNKTQVVDCYRGMLPDHNEIAVNSLRISGNHTILTLDTLWKAPFYFDILPQRYANPDNRNFDITALTAEYVEITFCYATKFEGNVNIPADNPLFSRAELTQNQSDCTLRLYLKKTGGFYGWDAYYNDKDQLCFRFVNPVKATATTANKYGADLTGLRIMIDVGHGGDDGGAKPNGAAYDEAALNLQLAMRLKAELESMGATVIMNRTTDVNISVQARIDYLKEQAPDLCIAIHQNSGEKDSYNGGWVCYYTPFSKKAAEAIYAETEKVGVYQRTDLYWDNTKYYVGRETVCPVVLMENGFMTNEADYATMVDANAQQKKAEAMAQGTANYFLSIK